MLFFSSLSHWVFVFLLPPSERGGRGSSATAAICRRPAADLLHLQPPAVGWREGERKRKKERKRERREEKERAAAVAALPICHRPRRLVGKPFFPLYVILGRERERRLERGRGDRPPPIDPATFALVGGGGDEGEGGSSLLSPTATETPLREGGCTEREKERE